MPELRVRASASRHMLLAAMNVPVLRADGSVRCIVRRVEDVSGFVRTHDAQAAERSEYAPDNNEQAFDVLVELADRTRALERANRRLQSTQTLIQRTVDSAAIGVLMLDPAHRVVLQNAAARALLHATRSELMEVSVLDLVHGADRALLENALAVDALAAGEHQWLEVRPSWSDDGEQWLRISIAAADRADDGAHRLVLLEDISLL